MSDLLLKNIGTIVSGNIDHPILEGDAILALGGKVSRVGFLAEWDDIPDTAAVIDCHGTTVTPGLIDSHCHPILGDYTSRQQQTGFLESELHGGVTTMISAGEVHLQGRPKDPAGVKALAILAAKSFQNFRPGGAKVAGGAVILENGLVQTDFEEMARECVHIVGEVGLGSVKDPDVAAPMIQWAKDCGMTVMMHTGGTSIPGSSTVTADMVMRANPDIASHVNGGPTAVAMDEVRQLTTQTDIALEIVHCGNPLMAVEAAKLFVENKVLHRVIIGNDAPSGTGVVPLGILRVINHLAGLTPVTAAQAICMATGNTARIHKLNRGIIEPGREADFVIMDTPMGSVGKDALAAIEAGDVPGVAMVIVDGKVVVTKSRNTPPPVTMPEKVS
ncbi:MAG: amidohydrolase family protein [Desulfotignum sp.]|nr:amidohydrolase family protein [Desulfotignum sp.]